MEEESLEKSLGEYLVEYTEESAEMTEIISG